MPGRRVLAGGGDPIVVDSRRVLEDPERTLGLLCGRLGIDWDPAMLSWEPGPKPEDGVWGPHWYGRLWETTGFEPYRPKGEPVPDHLLGVLEECERHYMRLREHAIA